MQRIRIIPWLLLAVSLPVLSACGGVSGGATPTIDTAPVYTQIAATALALQAQTAIAVPTATNTPKVSPTPKATNISLATETPLAGTATATRVALKTPLATSQASCDNMQYVADVTYQDGYVAAPGEYMIKTWTVKNLGPCAWNKNYVLVFGWGGVGTSWNTIGSVNLTKDVAPGETIDISVSLEAPKISGDYSAIFVLQNDKGFNFPPGQVLSISIKVK